MGPGCYSHDREKEREEREQRERERRTTVRFRLGSFVQMLGIAVAALGIASVVLVGLVPLLWQAGVKLGRMAFEVHWSLGIAVVAFMGGLVVGVIGAVIRGEE